LKFRESSTSAWTDVSGGFNSQTTKFFGGGTLDVDKSYEAFYSVSDQFVTVEVIDVISRYLPTMEFLHGGFGVAFFKEASRPRLDVAGLAHIEGLEAETAAFDTLDVTGNVQIAGTLKVQNRPIVSWEAANILEVSNALSGNRVSLIDFHGADGADYTARIGVYNDAPTTLRLDAAYYAVVNPTNFRSAIGITDSTREFRSGDIRFKYGRETFYFGSWSAIPPLEMATSRTISFTEPFPNAVLACFVTSCSGGAWWVNQQWQNTSGIGFYPMATVSQGSGTYQVDWLAIGY
jgi:hypothetical protein